MVFPVFLKLFKPRHTKSKIAKVLTVWKGKFGCFEIISRKILTVLKKKIWTVWKGNFDSLKRKILTVWKGKFWQFGKKILTVWKGKFWQFGKGNFDSLESKFLTAWESLVQPNNNKNFSQTITFISHLFRYYFPNFFSFLYLQVRIETLDININLCNIKTVI